MTTCIKRTYHKKTANNPTYCRFNFDRLKLMRKELPLKGNMKDVWLNIGKVIDPLHISNHKVG